MIIFSVNISFSQNVSLEGKITDELGISLEFANIFAYPEKKSSVAYAISGKAGQYKLTLLKNQLYKVTISYLGFISQTFQIRLQANQVKNITLIESSEKLDDVTLNYIPPVVVKKDTITYQTDAFTTGEERKLRDILKKLPAVEVDRAGNVTVQGKRVTRVLVEDKEFFTGDSKLAVNNIPADAIDKVQVLNNYNEVGFLKDLEESEDVAMNIKLKENKKKFIFGDVESGGGVKERYLVHPSLYYYSSNTSINFIGDFNNTGTRSFTIKDYIEFEGGKNKLINNDKSYFSLLNDDITQFIGGRDFTASRNQFGAISLTQAVNTKTDLSGYGIFSNTRDETEVQTLNDYIASKNLIENRVDNGNQNSRFGIGKFKLRYKPNDFTDFTIGSYVKVSSNNSQNSISTITKERRNIINTNIDIENTSVRQEVKWHKQFSENHTTSVVFNYHYQKATPNTNWLTDKTILQGLIPVVAEHTFNIFKNKESKSHNADFILKHYWVLNRFNHIYFSFGSQLSFDNYETREFQILKDGTINDFSVSEFGNDTGFNFNDIFMGIQYKVQKGKFIFKPGIFFHNYNWIIKQFEEHANNNKTILLPEFNTDFQFNNTKKLNFKYNLKVRFPNISQVANRFTLLNFNSIYQGNQSLESERYHHAQISFYSFNLFKDLFYNFTISYRFKDKNFKNTTTIQGIDFVSSPVLSNFKDKYGYLNSSIRKGFGNYKFSLRGSISLADYETPINKEIIANTSNTYVIGSKIDTHFKNFPNLELGYTKSISEYKANTSTVFQKDVFLAFLEYDFLNDFIFKADYSFENYKNKTSNAKQTFNIANTSLFYQKKDTPWGFEISANNIFDIAFKQRNSFSSILVSDEKSFILPRIMMFKLSYKL